MKKRLSFAFISTLFLITFSFILLKPSSSSAEQKKGYIVVYKQNRNSDTVSQSLKEGYGVEVFGIYKHAIKAAFIYATDEQIDAIKKNNNIAFVEENKEWSIEGQILPTGVKRIFADTNDEISINGTSDYTVDADVAVIDTGIDLDHPDLNVVHAIDCTLNGPYEGTCDGVKDDGNGHGTHVAGIVGALDNGIGVVGVAPGVRLWAVKVLTNYGTGTTAQIIAGIDYVALHSEDIEVANMSLGSTGESEAMDLAISNTVSQGVVFAVAAGNKAIDVSGYHPASNPDVITVSALADFDGIPGGLGVPTCRDDLDDTLVSFSNFGEGVEISAPGVCIYSTYMDGAYATLSGTSMASPHVAGAAALIASANPDYTPDEIRNVLVDNGNYDWTDDSPDGILEPLLDVGNGAIFDPFLLPTEHNIELTVIAYKESALQVADLNWSGADSANVDIYRDGSYLVNTENDGFYTDYIGIKGRGIHTYRLCEEGMIDDCSETVTVKY